MKIGCDLIRDLTIYKIPQNYFDGLNKDIGVVLVDPNKLPPFDILEGIEIYFGDRINLNIISKMPNLKWIHLTSVGVDKLIGLDREDIIITNSKGIMDESIISTILAFIFSLSRGIHYCLSLKNKIDRYSFDKYIDKIQDINGQTCLIVGMGNIGNKLKFICEALNMKVIGIRKNKFGNNIFTLNELKDIVNKADYVINLLPYTNQTDKIFNIKIFKKMKSTSFFINVGRGKTVVEKDLIWALKNNKIAGAGLDVFEKEPLSKNSPLRKLNNTIITPHIAGYSNKFWKGQRALFSTNLERFINSEKMLNNVKL